MSFSREFSWGNSMLDCCIFCVRWWPCIWWSGAAIWFWTKSTRWCDQDCCFHPQKWDTTKTRLWRSSIKIQHPSYICLFCFFVCECVFQTEVPQNHDIAIAFCFNGICPWWCHQIETVSALLAICAKNSPVTGEFPHKDQWRGALMIFWSAPE